MVLRDGHIAHCSAEDRDARTWICRRQLYASREARAAYRWMWANQPVFRNRTGLAAASTYQAVIDAERQPELFSNAGGPDQPALPMMIDMDDPAHLLRRVEHAGFTGSGQGQGGVSIAAL